MRNGQIKTGRKREGTKERKRKEKRNEHGAQLKPTAVARKVLVVSFIIVAIVPTPPSSPPPTPSYAFSPFVSQLISLSRFTLPVIILSPFTFCSPSFLSDLSISPSPTFHIPLSLPLLPPPPLLLTVASRNMSVSYFPSVSRLSFPLGFLSLSSTFPCLSLSFSFHPHPRYLL